MPALLDVKERWAEHSSGHQALAAARQAGHHADGVVELRLRVAGVHHEAQARL
ncbi:conserved hypothetical protein, partial [Ricinus communis]